MTKTILEQKKEDRVAIAWRARLRRRRGKAFNPVAIREFNLVAMMDMMTLILVFLLKSYSVSAMSIPVGEEMSVPKSSNLTTPAEAVKLTVTKIGGRAPGVMAVDEDRVMELDPKRVATLEAQARDRKFLIKELKEKLDQKAETIKKISQINPSVKFEGKISVIADKDLPYWLITQILYTAAEAQFEQYNLVAMKEKGE
jgi:biopolymer transport protein ExbD